MMGEDPLALLVREYHEKTRKAISLHLHSARKVAPSDPATLAKPDALEAYDALSGRFERTVDLIVV